LVDFTGDQSRIYHNVFGGTRVDIDPVNFKSRSTCVKVFKIDRSFLISVRSICVIGTERPYVEIFRSPSDFFIRCETDADFPMRNLFFDDFFAGSHNLGDAGLIVRTQ